MKPVPKQRLMRVGKAAIYLGLNRETLRKYADLGQIPCKRIRGERWFLIEHLDAWIDAQPEWNDTPPHTEGTSNGNPEGAAERSGADRGKPVLAKRAGPLQALVSEHDPS